jgi:hypothetical protein
MVQGADSSASAPPSSFQYDAQSVLLHFPEATAVRDRVLFVNHAYLGMVTLKALQEQVVSPSFALCVL